MDDLYLPCLLEIFRFRFTVEILLSIIAVDDSFELILEFKYFKYSLGMLIGDNQVVAIW